MTESCLGASLARRWLAAVATAFAAFIASPQPADAQEPPRWEADAAGAVATIPLPEGTELVESATLSCSADAWTLALGIGGEAELEDGPATLVVDGRGFPAPATAEGRMLRLPVPLDAIEPLKAGARMSVDFDGALEALLGDPVFALRGSRVAITAAEERCPPPDMSGYEAVAFSAEGEDTLLMRQLRAADIAAFAQATASAPEAAAALVELEGDRRLLFTRLCGSSWYYGLSGCNVTGFAQGGGIEEWQVVYDTEGVHVYLDGNEAADGWPDIVTLPMRARGEQRRWHWEGGAYALVQMPVAAWELRTPVADGEVEQ